MHSLLHLLPRHLTSVGRVIAACTWLVMAGCQSNDSSPAPSLRQTVSPSQIPVYKASHALVIGISRYTGGWPSLSGVPEDVHEVSKTLHALGFQVTEVHDPDLYAMEQAYRDFIFGHGQDRDNRLLFYFAGHGHTMKPPSGTSDRKKWLGYLVSSNAPDPYKDEKGFLKSALSMKRFEVWSSQIKAKHVLFMFDSCFSGARGFNILRPNIHKLQEGISDETGALVRQFISAGSEKERVPDDSIFHKEFIGAISGGRPEADYNGDRVLTGLELGWFLQKEVARKTNHGQTPQYGTPFDEATSKGDFVFSATLPPPIANKHPTGWPQAYEDQFGIEFSLIPTGSFSQILTDGSHRRITIQKPFYMAKYEITQTQWEAVMGSNPSYFRDKKNLPVESISWLDVQEFLSRLNNQNSEYAYYRLPTEVEWEWAARAQLQGTSSFGNDPNQLEQYAWFEGNAENRTHPVGGKSPTGFGLYDMRGNVWEWSADSYLISQQQDTAQQSTPVSSGLRAYRGCGWFRGTSDSYCQLTTRHGARPDFRHQALGVRLVQEKRRLP